jgi:hypothetical protein
VQLDCNTHAFAEAITYRPHGIQRGLKVAIADSLPVVLSCERIERPHLHASEPFVPQLGRKAASVCDETSVILHTVSANTGVVYGDEITAPPPEQVKASDAQLAPSEIPKCYVDRTESAEFASPDGKNAQIIVDLCPQMIDASRVCAHKKAIGKVVNDGFSCYRKVSDLTQANVTIR